MIDNVINYMESDCYSLGLIFLDMLSLNDLPDLDRGSI